MKDKSPKTTDSPRVQLVRVFVSSPGDVAAERDVLDEVVDRINRTEEFRLELFRWEKDVVPQIGPGPQAVVDEQTPEYDVYVGIMATRFGTPTEGAGSGTEKEFNDALAKWKDRGAPWIMFYFHDCPPAARTKYAHEQFGKVLDFRERLQVLGIVGTYDCVRGTARGFFEQVEIHLRRVLAKVAAAHTSSTATLHTGAVRRATLAVPDLYRRWLKAQCADIDLFGLRFKETRSIQLEHVYVPLTVIDPQYQAAIRVHLSAKTFLPLNTLWSDARPRHVLLLDMLDQESLLVTGAPGSGKSTFCRWCAWLTLASKMPVTKPEYSRNYLERFPSALAGRLTVILSLRDFWQRIPHADDSGSISRDALESALRLWIDDRRPGGLEGSVFADHLDEGKTLLILDGLDEVPRSSGETPRSWYPRARLVSGLAEAVPVWVDRGNRLLITSRPYGVDETDVRRLGLRHAPVSDLPSELREALVRRWFQILAATPEAAKAAADDLQSDLANRPELEPLAANPLMLTALCVLYEEGRRLPGDKHELYGRIVDAVLYRRYPRDRRTIGLIRNRLAVIAHAMHTGEWLGEKRNTPQAEATLDEIDRVLSGYRQKRPGTESDFASTIEAREDLLSHSGLLLERSDGSASFQHLSIQEFLAARRLLELQWDDPVGAFRDYASIEAWHNTLTFLFGDLAEQSLERSVDLIDELLQPACDVPAGLAIIMADCMAILECRGVSLQEALKERMRQICLTAIESGAEPLRWRFALGIVLGKLGDPRVVLDLRDRTGYRRVEAGQYEIGKKRKRVRIGAPFLLSKYPVTNAQFRLFLETGYPNDKWWSNGGLRWRTEAEGRESLSSLPDLNGPTQPVQVTYWQAEAFASWSGGRLPTEVEWEAAARGMDGREYPWGTKWENEICNTLESGLFKPSPVGIFPRSRSALGFEDMAGNVWEWCQKDDRPGMIKPSMRPLRGGASHIPFEGARCANRFSDWPAGRAGFRVLLSIAPELGRGG